MTFLDSMLQITILGSSKRSLRLPTRIGAIHVDPATHLRRAYAVQGKAQGSPVPAPVPPALSLCQPLPTLTACPHSG